MTPSTALPLMLALAAVFGAMRFAGMLGAHPQRWMLPLSFMMMMAAPWLLLNAQGRRQIGMTRARWSCCAIALPLGALAALICFGLGMLLFGTSGDNWFVTIAASYRATMDTSHFSLVQSYLIFTIPALLFSPIGEELFFRGMLQRAFEDRCGVRLGTVIECALFGVIHLCHHGLVLDAAGLALRPLSGVLWMLSMFAVALLFAALRRRSGSLLPAMAAHAAFNAMMNLVIFGYLWGA
jgi:membrane protease YdiL (CAAX protease family)